MVSDKTILIISFAFLLLTVSYSVSSISGHVFNDQERKSCEETDDLLDLFTNGITSGNIGSLTYEKQDRCVTQYTISEYYCEDNAYRRLTYKCPNGCSNGVCL